MRCAIVYERDAVLYIRTSSRTTDEVWIEDGPCSSMPVDSRIEEIAEAVRTALESSKSGIPHPGRQSWGHVLDALLEAAGVKTWAVFSKTAICLKVELEVQLRIAPTKNLGSKGGFVEIEGKAIVLSSSATLTEIGVGIKRALSIAE